MEKAVTKKSAAKRIADLKKGKGTASGKKRKTTRRKQGGSLTSSYNRRNTALVVSKFVKLFAFEIPDDVLKAREKKAKSKNGGRPPVVDAAVLYKLETAFGIDCTVEEACILAGISTKTYYNFVKECPEFLHSIELLRNIPFLLARQTIVDGIMNNYAQAMDYMSRKKKTEFSHKLELSHEGGIKHTHTIDPKTKKAVDNIFLLFENKAKEVTPKYAVKDDDE